MRPAPAEICHAPEHSDAALDPADAIFSRMSAARQALGKRGEAIAARWLRDRGWRVLDRRFRSGHRDIDLVAERDGVIAFVEVKTRSGDRFGDPVEAVDWRKQRELRRSAEVWIARHGGLWADYRFDVIGVLCAPEAVRVRHVEGAFQVGRTA